MKLLIDTTDPEKVTLTLTSDHKTIIHVFQTDRNLSEKLIPEIEKFLSKQKVKLSDLRQIEAAGGAGHFSRIRTALATANALAYGLNIKQPILKAVYSGEPNITLSKGKT
jgi:tRNA A37 threonylcarbamoyladenosine modification protein TsaB